MVEGAIECGAKMFRRQGRWVLVLEMPEWVAIEALPEIKNPEKGLVGVLNGTPALLTVAAGSTPKAAPPEPPRRPVQIMPEGLIQPGIPLEYPEAPRQTRARTVVPPDQADADMRDYLRQCIENSKPVDFDQVKQETGLGPIAAKRFIQRIIAENLDRKYITDAQARALIQEKLRYKRLGPGLPRDESGKVIRKGVAKNPMSEETKRKISEAKQRAKVAKLAAAGGG